MWITSFGWYYHAIYHVFVCTKGSIDDVKNGFIYLRIQLIWISLGSASRLQYIANAMHFVLF